MDCAKLCQEGKSEGRSEGRSEGSVRFEEGQGERIRAR